MPRFSETEGKNWINDINSAKFNFQSRRINYLFKCTGPNRILQQKRTKSEIFSSITKNIPLLITQIPLLINVFFLFYRDFVRFKAYPASDPCRRRVALHRKRGQDGGTLRPAICRISRRGLLCAIHTGRVHCRCINEWPIQQFPLIRALWASENRAAFVPAREAAVFFFFDDW